MSAHGPLPPPDASHYTRPDGVPPRLSVGGVILRHLTLDTATLAGTPGGWQVAVVVDPAWRACRSSANWRPWNA